MLAALIAELMRSLPSHIVLPQYYDNFWRYLDVRVHVASIRFEVLADGIAKMMGSLLSYTVFVQCYNNCERCLDVRLHAASI